MFEWLKIAEKGFDLTKVIFGFIDDSDFTDEEKAEKKEKVLSIGLDKIKIKADVIKKALGLANLDAKSGNKYQSYARPSIIWLFILLIMFSYVIAFLNYYNNDLFLAYIDGVKNALSIIPNSVINGFYTVMGIYTVGRTAEKITKIIKDKL